MQVFNQNDYPHHQRQINIFKAQYKTGTCQSDWYVFGICGEKKPNVVYNSVSTGFCLWLVYESHRKVIFLQTMVYRVVYDKSGIVELYGKNPYKDV